ncbi:uncharacterized [Tachysurus ichikawai]
MRERREGEKKTYKGLIICTCVGQFPQWEHKPFSLLINKNGEAKLVERSGTAAAVANTGGSGEAKIYKVPALMGREAVTFNKRLNKSFKLALEMNGEGWSFMRLFAFVLEPNVRLRSKNH